MSSFASSAAHSKEGILDPFGFGGGYQETIVESDFPVGPVLDYTAAMGVPEMLVRSWLFWQNNIGAQDRSPVLFFTAGDGTIQGKYPTPDPTGIGGHGDTTWAVDTGASWSQQNIAPNVLCVLSIPPILLRPGDGFQIGLIGGVGNMDPGAWVYTVERYTQGGGGGNEVDMTPHWLPVAGGGD